MKTIVYFENENTGMESTVRQISRIRQIHPADTLVVLSAGDYHSDGNPCAISARDRAKLQSEAGTDLILSLPAASILGGYGKRNFASAALIQRLHCVDRIVFSCSPLSGQAVDSCAGILKHTAMTIFRESPKYRQELQSLLQEHMPFQKAQIQAAASCVPDAASLLADPENQYTILLLDAMLQLYYMADTEFLDLRELTPQTENRIQSASAVCPSVYPSLTDQRGDSSSTSFSWPDQRGDSSSALSSSPDKRRVSFEQNAAQAVKKLLPVTSPGWLRDIAGCTDAMVQMLCKEPDRFLDAATFSEMTAILCSASLSAETARLFLLRMILQITHSTMQINALHLYTPYCYVHAFNEAKQEQLDAVEKNSWVSFLREGDADILHGEQYSKLLQADRKAELLCAEPTSEAGSL